MGASPTWRWARIALPGALATLFAVGAGANPWPGPLEADRFDRIGMAEGLSQGRVFDIHQDRRGFLWIATQNGLNRFDGYSFEIYLNDPANPTSIGNNYIRSIHEDARGRLYLGSGSGVDRLDPVSGHAEHFRHRPGDPTSLPSDAKDYLAPRANGGFWVLSQPGGLVRMTDESGVFDFLALELDSESTQVVDVIEKPDGQLWCLTEEGLKVFDSTGRRLESPSVDIPRKLLGPAPLQGLFEDHTGDLWIYTSDGLYRRPRGQTVEPVPLPPTSHDGDYILRVFEDSRRTLWVATADGVVAIDPTRQDLRRIRHNPAQPRSLSHNLVFNIFEDRSGVLWFGTNDGLSRLAPQRHAFAIYSHDPARPESPSLANVLTIQQTNDGSLWVGTHGGGIDRYDPERLGVRHFRYVAEDPTGISSDIVWALFQDSRGVLWAGTENGLDRFEPTADGRGRFHHLRHRPGDPTSLADGRVLTLLEGSTGHLWIGSSSGLQRMDPTSERFETVPFADDPHPVLALHEDPHGDLWIGTDHGGLHRRSPGGEVEAFLHDPRDPSSLGHNVVAAVLEGTDGTLWIGTLGGGLQRFDPASRTFSGYRRVDGLPNDAVKCLLEDTKGFLWVSTDRGLARFDPRRETFETFDATDGLPTSNFITKSCHRGHEGELFFGSRELVAFQPGQEIDLQDPPAVELIRVEVRDRLEPLIPLGSSPPGSRAYRQLTLTHRDTVIDFAFSALHFAAPQKNRYQYRLDGFDEDWISTGADERHARYTNLDPGQYTFRVRGSNSDGVWSTGEATLEFSVLPSPWRSPWAHTAYALLALAGVAYFLRSQRLEVAHLREVDQLKDALLQEKRRQIATLEELLPMCVSCKKIRDDAGYWQDVEIYITSHTTSEVSHGLCPSCANELYPDVALHPPKEA